MIHRKKVRRDIYDYDYIGVVEDISDPIRLGRARIRIESLHGRKTDAKFIPTEHLPWYEPSSRGTSFSTSSIGKVVYVSFETDDYYKGSYFSDEHYNINLQNKLDSYSQEDYENFYAFNFDDEHQYYYEPHKGLIFDYKKSYIKISDDADISINLKDNSSTLYLGSENASQSLMLGDNWMNWFDSLVQTLQSIAFLGNLGAPTVPSPGLIAVLQQYQTMRRTFLSKHIFAPNNDSIKTNNRAYDNTQLGDNYKTEDDISTPSPVQPKEEAKQEAAKKEEPKVIENPSNPVTKLPANNAESKMLTTIQRASMDDIEKFKFVNPTSVENGKYDISTLRASKYLSMNFNSTDERRLLLSEVSSSLDAMLDEFNKIADNSYAKIVATKGYVDYNRQDNTKKLNPLYPSAGTDPFGYANQIELTIDSYAKQSIYPDIKDAYYDYFNNKYDENVPQLKTFDWLMKNSSKFNIVLAGNYDSNNNYQYWHFIYKV